MNVARALSLLYTSGLVSPKPVVGAEVVVAAGTGADEIRAELRIGRVHASGAGGGIWSIGVEDGLYPWCPGRKLAVTIRPGRKLAVTI